jgi:hypothetical protein
MAVAKVNNRGSIAAAQKANRLANKALLDQATDDLNCGSDDSGDENELVERQLLEGEQACCQRAYCRRTCC